MSEAQRLRFERLKKQKQQREDERWGRLSNRDYLPEDAGEPPKGADW